MSPESVAEATKHCPSCSCFKPRPKRRSGLKRDAADARWSKMVRERADYRCQFWLGLIGDGFEATAANAQCANTFETNSQGLHAAHCFGRAIKATRTDPDNGLAMCWPHHRAIDSDKTLKYAIFRMWLGDERFDALSDRARAKRDRKVG